MICLIVLVFVGTVGILDVECDWCTSTQAYIRIRRDCKARALRVPIEAKSGACTHERPTPSMVEFSDATVKSLNEVGSVRQ